MSEHPATRQLTFQLESMPPTVFIASLLAREAGPYDVYGA